jgi:hypothetical protein
MSKKINQLKVNLVAIHKLWLVISMAVAAVYLTLNSQHLVLYVIAGTLAFHSLSFVLAAIIRQESINSRKKS